MSARRPTRRTSTRSSVDKDMAAGPFPGPIEIVGEEIIDFPAIFDAAGGRTRYYVVEHDPRFGDPTFDPFEAAEKGFD
jgi:hypothetical protein